jgi:hypothetical protein
MTTITVEINEDKDLSALKEVIAQLGLKYHVEENEGLVYTDEIKAMLDKRYADYKNGIKMVSSEESKQEIEALLSGKNK